MFSTLDVQMAANPDVEIPWNQSGECVLALCKTTPKAQGSPWKPELPRTQAKVDRDVAASFANWRGRPGATSSLQAPARATSSRPVAAAASDAVLDEGKEQTTAAPGTGGLKDDDVAMGSDVAVLENNNAVLEPAAKRPRVELPD